MLVVVLSLLDKQDLPAAGLSLRCFLEGELGEATEPQGAAGPGHVLATLWHSVYFEVMCVPSVVGNKISDLQRAMELLPTPWLVASPGAGAAGPGTAARRRQQSLRSGISESVTGRPTPFPRCLTSVYFV